MGADRQALYNRCREQWPTLSYDEYAWHADDCGLHIEFCFSLDSEHQFHPTATIEARPFLDMRIGKEVIDRLVFNIGMVELVSYWKCVCPPVVEVKCGELSEEQIAFWRKLYWHGLGEFFYTNGIAATADDFMTIVVHRPTSDSPIVKSPLALDKKAYIVPIGGGKDSVVTLEMLRPGGGVLRPLIMNPRGATIECARVAGYDLKECIVIGRCIDPLLLEMNAQGYLNGHTPFSAMLAFYTLLASALSGISNIALSNESSANEATVIGTEVNHQYSKSLEFENDFRRYAARLLPESNYFSFLRPLTELHIARLFSRLCVPYQKVFRSCNVGSKQDVWCGHCAKCLFAYIILSPFLPPDTLEDIFEKNLLDDESLRTEFDQLIGAAPTKPFECVGTIDEVNTALALAIQRYYQNGKPALLKQYLPAAPNLTLFSLANEHNLSQAEFELMESTCIANSN